MKMKKHEKVITFFIWNVLKKFGYIATVQVYPNKQNYKKVKIIISGATANRQNIDVTRIENKLLKEIGGV